MDVKEKIQTIIEGCCDSHEVAKEATREIMRIIIDIKGTIPTRIDDLEIRQSEKTLEIVKWEREACYTICYWVDDDLKFVGDRPISDEIDWDTLRILIKIGYNEEI